MTTSGKTNSGKTGDVRGPQSAAEFVIRNSRKGITAAAREFNLPQRRFDGVVKGFFEALNCPVSLSCWLQYEAGEFDDLVSREINPGDYNDPESFRNAFAAISFLRKNEFLATSFDRQARALEKFRQSEEVCRLVNIRFQNLSRSPEYQLEDTAALLHAMTRKIEKILSPWSAEELFESGSFGPGSSPIVTGDDTSAERKFREERTITGFLYQLVWEPMKIAYPLWFRDGGLKLGPVFCEFSKVITVKKNATIDRTIAIEPGINLWFQKAVGQMIRKRLLRSGVNLSGSRTVIQRKLMDSGSRYVQTWQRINRYIAKRLEQSSEINGQAARQGSKDSSLATIDFSAASDTISYELVRELIPHDWFVLLASCRTARYQLPGDTEAKLFHKFSSMGNGFTFELESLLFYTAALAVVESIGLREDQVSIFGDDVIIPNEAADVFARFTAFLGFKVNVVKSYSTTYFRESCGEYYFSGVDVKPLFLKKWSGSTFDVYNLANRIRMFAHNGTYGCDGRFEAVWKRLLKSLPEKLRLFGTLTGGHGCLWSNFDEAHPTRLSKGLEGYSFRTFSFPAVMLDTDHPSLVVARVFSSSDREYSNSYSLRRRTRTVLTNGSTQQWYDFGPWLH